MIIYVFSGVSLARTLLYKERPLVRIWLGGVLGLVMLLWIPTLVSFLLDFTILSQMVALFITATIGCVSICLSKNKRVNITSWKSESDLLFVLLPLLTVGIVLLSTHTIMEFEDGSLYVGQSTYGDLSMHLGFITSIAEQHTFPPMYSICPDTALGYPFLSDSISSTFYVLGANLRFATMLPAMYAYALVLLGVYMFYERWMRDTSKTQLAAFLFFLGGGFGFAYFFEMLQLQPDNFSRIFHAFYETPTNNVSVGIKWVNPIADMLVPQRATLFGWALLFPCLYLLLRAGEEKERSFFPLLGVIAGAMPLVHTHSFLALGIISTVCLLRSILHAEGKSQFYGYMLYAGIVAVLAGPQLLLFTFKQSGDFLQVHWNWANFTDNTIWFYIKNLGLLFLLLPAALLDTSSRNRGIVSGAGVLWFIAETIQFQPNPYDNNKLLFVCFAYLCGLVADYLIRIYRRLTTAENGHTLGTKCMALLTCTALFLSGFLTLGREIVSEYQLFYSDEVQAAEYVKENIPPSSTFLTHNNHNNTIAALTGRNIVCGSGSFLYYHGVNYGEREAALSLLYEEPTAYFDTLSAKYDIDYVYVSSHERYNYDCDMGYFISNYKCIFENGTVMIFDVNQAP